MFVPIHPEQKNKKWILSGQDTYNFVWPVKWIKGCHVAQSTECHLYSVHSRKANVTPGELILDNPLHCAIRCRSDVRLKHYRHGQAEVDHTPITRKIWRLLWNPYTKTSQFLDIGWQQLVLTRFTLEALSHNAYEFFTIKLKFFWLLEFVQPLFTIAVLTFPGHLSATRTFNYFHHI